MPKIKSAPKAQVKPIVSGATPSDYLEVRLELVGCMNYQKAGAVVGIRTTDKNLLPKGSNKADIKKALKDLYEYVAESMEEVAEKTVDAAEWLSNECAKRSNVR